MRLFIVQTKTGKHKENKHELLWYKQVTQVWGPGHSVRAAAVPVICYISYTIPRGGCNFPVFFEVYDDPHPQLSLK